MKYYVYYNDDYYSNGGVGVETLDTLQNALEFIEHRLEHHAGAVDLSSYHLIEGKEIKLQAVASITKVLPAQE